MGGGVRLGGGEAARALTPAVPAAAQVAKGVPDDLKKKYGMGAVEAWRYLNLDAKHPAQWDLFPATFDELSAAMDAIPTLAKLKDATWRIMIAILCAVLPPACTPPAQRTPPA